MRITMLVGASLFTACAPQSPSTPSPGDNGVADPGGPDGNTPTTPPDGGSTGTGGDTGMMLASTGPYFSVPMFFNRDVSATPKGATSDQTIAALKAEGGWGTGAMQIDFAIDVLKADASTPMKTFTTTGDFFSPDCDHVPMPVPVGGNVEGESAYACTGGGDCHLIVDAGDKLYEMWRADITSQFNGGCLAVWNTTQAYTDSLRGLQCSSADAAGFPIAPLLFTADEVASGTIAHAIRFILPNNRVVRGFTKPATHATNTTGTSAAPAYGVHLKLRADFPIDSLPSAGAKVVARAMQKYGMYHADGGNIALTAQSDRHTVHKWSGLLGSHDLASLKVEDFEVIDHGGMIPLTSDCVR